MMCKFEKRKPIVAVSKEPRIPDASKKAWDLHKNPNNVKGLEGLILRHVKNLPTSQQDN